MATYTIQLKDSLGNIFVPATVYLTKLISKYSYHFIYGTISLDMSTTQVNFKGADTDTTYYRWTAKKTLTLSSVNELLMCLVYQNATSNSAVNNPGYAQYHVNCAYHNSSKSVEVIVNSNIAQETAGIPSLTAYQLRYLALVR